VVIEDMEFVGVALVEGGPTGGSNNAGFKVVDR
jgi:hypothetical protein